MAFKFSILKSRHNFYSWRGGFFGRFCFLMIAPLIFTWLMFDPFLRIDLKSNTNEPQYISRSEINESLTHSVLAEIFQTSLRLGWYQLCFENQGALTMGGHTVVDREDRGDIQIQIREIFPSPFINDYQVLVARPYEKDCLTIGSGVEGINVGTSTVSLGTSINDTWEDVTMLSNGEFTMTFTIDYLKMHIYIKQDWLAFITKYFVILVLWASFILLIKSIWVFLLPDKKSKN